MVIRARRSSVAARAPSPHTPSLSTRVWRVAGSRPAKVAYATIGAVGLTALAVAIFGPGRFRREIFQPVRNAVSDQAEKLWLEAQPLRAQLGGLIQRAASEAGREKLVRDFQSWIGHFRAT